MTERLRPGGVPLSRRYLIYYAVTYISLIALMGYFVDRSAREALIEGVEANLQTTAAVAATELPDEVELLAGWAEKVFEASGFRATLILTDGVVVAESHSDPSVMENHIDRPEVQTALSGSIGIARRVSASTGFEQLYVALPPNDAGQLVRLSTPVRVVEESLGSLRRSIVAIAIAAGLIGVLAVAWIARRTAKPIAGLTEQSRALAEGDLDVTPQRSSIRELDQLGLAISDVALEQKERLSEVHEASETLKVVLGAIPQGTVLVGPDDRILYANPSSSGLLGPLPDQLSALVPLQFQSAVRLAREDGAPVSVDVDHGRQRLRLRGTATPFAEDDRVLLIVVDITERERTDEVKRDFAANASHELKTPVATIVAAAEALQIAMANDDESAAGFADQIEASALQLSRLVSDLLDLSRVESQTPEPVPVRFDLVVRDEVLRAKEKVPGKIIQEAIGDGLLAMASHRDLAIATRNLLDNALRHTEPAEAITVSLSTEDGEAVLTVSDEGEGIPSRDLERVFERFYRVDSARARSTGGTGLGLAIVKHVAESHRGTVEVESELGVGSTFRLRIPLADEGSSSGAN